MKGVFLYTTLVLFFGAGVARAEGEERVGFFAAGGEPTAIGIIGFTGMAGVSQRDYYQVPK